MIELEYLSYSQLHSMPEGGELSSAVYHRRQTLIAIAELAKTSKGHTPLSRWRLKRFRAVLDGMEGNDEVEVTGETMCEMVMLAMDALPDR